MVFHLEMDDTEYWKLFVSFAFSDFPFLLALLINFGNCGSVTVQLGS
jgi:hypothetical protein